MKSSEVAVTDENSMEESQKSQVLQDPLAYKDYQML